jgi:MFS family permease
VVLGIVSLLTDISTEMMLPLFPIFTVQVLGATPAVLGLIEGLAESAASLLKVFSGWWSDRIGRRKPLVVGGYWLSTIAKPFLALASTWTHALGVRFTDRVGKGIRTSPRDALLADSCAPSVRGKAFGLHRALDTVGAILGPTFAFLLLLFLGFRDVFLLASIPAMLSVIVLIFFVREVKKKRTPKLSFRVGLGSLSPGFRRYLTVVTLFSLANLSWAFLILRASELGLGIGQAVLLYMLFNVVYALVSLPAGVLSDRVGRRPVIASGYCIFGFTSVGFALVTSAWLALPLFVLYGVFMGFVEGVQRAHVADLVAPRFRGTAMGAFHTTTGLAMLPASVIAGVLWQVVGSWAAFAFAAVLSFVAALLMVTALKPQ